MRHHEYEDEFGEFGWLKGEGTDRNPALRTSTRLAFKQHHCQQDQDNCIGRIRQSRDAVIVPYQHDQKCDGAEQDPKDLLCKKRQPRTPLIMGYAVDRKHADSENGDDQPKVSQVEIIQPAPIHHAINHSHRPCPLVRAKTMPYRSVSAISMSALYTFR